MGVIYKLKQEVIDFVLNAKKENPSISCRKLSILASKKFNKKISKSSINSVLKNALMSSSVGRRKGQSDKSFQIPDFKKKQITESLKDIGFVQEEAKEEPTEIKKEKETAIDEPLAEKKEGKADFLDQKKDASGALPKTDRGKILGDGIKLTIKTDEERKKDLFIEEKFFEKVKNFRKEASEGFSSALEGMGLIFLKAIEWETSGKSFFGKLFAKYFSASFDLDFDACCNSLVYLHHLGVTSDKDIEKLKGQSFWVFDGIEDLDRVSSFIPWLEHDSMSEELLFEYDLYKEQVFLEAAYFTIALEDGTTLVCDSNMRAFYEAEPVCKITRPFFKAISDLSSTIISNKKDVISCFYPKDNKSLEHAYEIISCFEGEQNKKMKKITAFDENDKQIVSLSILPEMKRSFILGFYNIAGTEGYLTGEEDVSLRSPYYSEKEDRIVYYSEAIREIKLKEGVMLLRTIFLAINKIDSAKFIILTNKKDQKVEDVLEEFLNRFPDFDSIVVEGAFLRFSWEKGTDRERNAKSGSLTAINPSTGGAGQKEVQKLLSIRGLLEDYFISILEHCKNVYFPDRMFEQNLNNLFAMLCGIKGSYKKEKGRLLIKMDLTEHQIHRDLFALALKKFNNNNILDHKGAKITIEI